MRRLGNVPALDGLRAIAILLVLSVHDFRFPPGGTVGVDLFFVLSGFLITTLLLEERNGTGRIRFRAFYVRRARRLLPGLAGLLIVYLAATTAAGQAHLLPVAAGALYFGNVVVASGHSMSGLGRLWSLAEEEQFYFVWPFLLLVLAKSRRVAVWTVLLALSLATYRAVLLLHGASGSRVYFGPDTHADGLIVGATLAAARLRWELQFGEWAGKIGLAALIPAALFACRMRWWGVWAQPVFEVCVALLIGAAFSQTELARGLGSRILVWIGRRSYGLYLWCGTVLDGLIFVFGPSYPTRAAAFGLTFVVASLSYRFVEQPFRRRRTPRRGDFPEYEPRLALGD
jgi:peptidoglycan/LPS O-acetylase OafA/YrhL